MNKKLLEGQSTLAAIVKKVKKFNLNNFFVPSFIIFTGISVFVVSYISLNEGLVLNGQSYPFFFVSAGFALLLKAFVATYANGLYAMSKKKWFLFSFNLICFAVQIFLGVFTGYVLTDTTYVLEPIQYLFIASGVFYIQNLVDNNFKILDLSLVSVGLYSGMYLAIFFQIFAFDLRFWNLTGLVSMFLEVFMFFVATRKFMKTVFK